MANAITLPALLDSLSNSLSSAIEAAPKLSGIDDIENGVSLLDVKNELLLSYLQNLVFLILIKIRNAKSGGSEEDSSEDSTSISDAVVKKLVELRLYLEKGVRPLEERLRFQLDKIIRAADDATRREEMEQDAEAAESESESGSDEESDADDAAEGGGADGKATSKENAKQGPLFSNFAAPVSVGMAAAAQDKTGVYRPPKITPTVMPTTERRERKERKPMKSATMNEYIADELSTAPSALPSVGSNVMFGGRKVKTAAEREQDERIREYEESNFIRLPKEGKKARAERNKLERRSTKMSFGGEEWRDLGEGVDRIDKLTRRKEGGRSTKALLEKSRKRGRETVDSARGSGFSNDTREIGERFSKKVKVMEGGRRDRGKR